MLRSRVVVNVVASRLFAQARIHASPWSTEAYGQGKVGSGRQRELPHTSHYPKLPFTFVKVNA